mgnify:CR=1 FL=1
MLFIVVTFIFMETLTFVIDFVFEQLLVKNKQIVSRDAVVEDPVQNHFLRTHD